MLVTENVMIGDKSFIRTYSDAGKLIMQLGTGIEYEEAIDSAEFPREYVESENSIGMQETVEDHAELEVDVGEVREWNPKVDNSTATVIYVREPKNEDITLESLSAQVEALKSYIDSQLANVTS